MQQDGLLQLVQVGPFLGRDLHAQDIATHILDHHVVLQQVRPHAAGIGAGFVDLVYGHDHGHFRRPGVVHGLDGLGHDAVVGGHHQDHDVGHLGAPGAHFGEGRMARRVDKGDRRPGLESHLVGTDVLGDAARLMRRHVGFAQRIEKQGLAVVDVPHHGHHRRPGNEAGLVVGVALEADLHIGVADALDVVAEFADHQFRRVGVDGLRHGHHDIHFHQRLDDVRAALGHAVGQLLHGDGFGYDHVADHLFLFRPTLLQSLLLPGAPGRGQAADALFALTGDLVNVDASGTAARLVTARGQGWTAGVGTEGPFPAAATHGFSLGFFPGHQFGRGGRRRGLGLLFAAAGLLVGLSAGFLLGPAGGLFGIGFLAQALFGLAADFRGPVRRRRALRRAGKIRERRERGLLPGCRLRFAGVLEGTGAGGLFLGGQADRRSLAGGAVRLRPFAAGGGKRCGGSIRGAWDFLLDLRHGAAGIGGIGALLADLDRHHLGAPMGKALPDLTGFDGLPDLQLSGPRQAQPPFPFLLFLFFDVGHVSPLKNRPASGRVVLVPETRQARRLAEQALGQPSRRQDQVYDALPSQCAAQFGAAEQVDQRQTGRQRPHPGASAGRAVGGGDQHRPAPRAQPRLRLVRSGHGLPGAARQPDEVETAARQKPFHPVGKIGRDGDACPRRLGEQVLGAGCIYHIPLCAQPNTPPRKASFHVRDHFPAGSDNEAQHLLFPAHRTADNAPPEGTTTPVLRAGPRAVGLWPGLRGRIPLIRLSIPPRRRAPGCRRRPYLPPPPRHPLRRLRPRRLRRRTSGRGRP